MFTSPSISQDRRRYLRHSAPQRRLTIGGEPAELIDWSFGGFGVRLMGDAGLFQVGALVPIAVFCCRTGAWESLIGRVQRIDQARRAVGITIDDDGAGSVRVLLELLASKLDSELLPRHEEKTAFTQC